MQLGVMGASGTWNYPEGGMVLPYLGTTFGSRESNVTFTGGYGQLFTNKVTSPIWYSGLSMKKKISSRWSLVFDSYLSGYTKPNERWQQSGTYTEFNGMAALAACVSNNKGGHVQLGGGVFSVVGALYPLLVFQFFQRM